MAKWNKGEPPSAGWWPASICRDKTTLRWFNGAYWSAGVSVRHGKHHAERLASLESCVGDYLIEWCNRPKNWPKRSFT